MRGGFSFRTANRATKLVVALLGVLFMSAVAYAATPTKDFSLGVAPSSVSVAAPVSGTSPASYTATVTPSGGFTGSVTLSMSGCPTGVTCPASVAVSVSSTSAVSQALVAQVGSSARAGTYSLTVKAVSGKLSHSQTVALVVPKKDFSVTASPLSVSVTKPTSGSATAPAYTATVSPLNGFTGSVSVSLSNCPSGVTCPASKTVSITTTSGAQSVALAATVSSSATPGTYTLLVAGSGGGLLHYVSVSLVIQSDTSSTFTMSASPTSQAVLQGDSTTFQATVTPSTFTGTVSLAATGLPSGATANFTPASLPVSGSTSASSTLTVTTTTSTPTGTYALTITGTSGSQSHSGTVYLTVGSTVPFSISGSVPQPLSPGVSAAINLALTNPYSFALKVLAVSVSVNDATSKPGCSGTQNFQATQYSGSYPISLPANTTTTLTALGIAQSQWPRLGMLDTAFNQDACKGATITLSYSGTATR